MTAQAIERDQIPAYQQAFSEVLAALHTDERHGLSESEARARLARYGRNELTADKPVPAWKKFLKQFQDALVILLLGATAISAGLWFQKLAAKGRSKAIGLHAEGSPVVSLNFADWVRCTMVASSVLWLRELSKAVTRAVITAGVTPERIP
jgi:P-type Ca2+ transporter type 2C